ncbi:MAG: type II toxin-antitoxin system HicB family antitoxin [Spirochaetes bacterium]|nr:type II toxin-antitoxin system HicB family antitoxin [Spirochaetota bacterium]
MEQHFTLEYWLDDNWYVGKLKEIPGIFSQGANLEELEENIKDAYRIMLEEDYKETSHRQINSKEIAVQI